MNVGGDSMLMRLSMPSTIDSGAAASRELGVVYKLFGLWFGLALGRIWLTGISGWRLLDSCVMNTLM